MKKIRHVRDRDGRLINIVENDMPREPIVLEGEFTYAGITGEPMLMVRGRDEYLSRLLRDKGIESPTMVKLTIEFPEG